MNKLTGLDTQPGRFVLLWHRWPDALDRKSHWDLMFEAGESLFTLELIELPVNQSKSANNPPQMVATRRLADHRKHYLTYEGPISGNRGEVQKIAEGTFASKQNLLSLESSQLTAELEIPQLAISEEGSIVAHRWHLMECS